MYDEEKVVTVGELRNLYLSGAYSIEIDTPDGYQPVSKWFDKGVMPLLQIEVMNGMSSRCATNHLLQRTSGEWMLAEELATGDEILTESGPSVVRVVIEAGSEQCYDFTVDHPNHRYWGDGLSSHNSGKSYLVSGNIVRDALAQGIDVVIIDTEDALKKTWMANLGVDTDHPNLHKEVCSTVNDVADCIHEYTNPYIEAFKDAPRHEHTKILFVVDSLGMLQTDTEIDQFENHDLKGDKGIKAKALKALVANCIRLFSGYELGLVATNHTYKSQNMYSPDDVISGGNGFLFAASIVVSMNKNKLKEDEAGKKVNEVLGIRSKLKCVKSRYAKPFEEIEVTIPYNTGMSRFSGLFDMCEQKGVFQKDGNRYRYLSRDGTEHKLFRKDMTPDFYIMVISEWNDAKETVRTDPGEEDQNEDVG